MTADTLRLEIRYVSSFVYADPVRESHNLLRACPAETGHQHLVSYDLSIQPTGRVHSYTDYWGTRVDAFGVNAHHDRLEVVADSLVETRSPPQPEDDPPVATLAGADFRVRHGQYLMPTAHTGWNGGTVAGAAEGVVARAAAVFDVVGDRLQYAPGATYVGMDVNEVFENGLGVCQDFAHLALAMLRAEGIPARYVSGYFYASPVGEAPRDAEIEVQTHAWLEVAVPGFGWWGFDPTNRQAAGARHVKIGHGRDYDDVAPLRGVYHGSADHDLGVSVRISREQMSAVPQQ